MTVKNRRKKKNRETMGVGKRKRMREGKTLCEGKISVKQREENRVKEEVKREISKKMRVRDGLRSVKE